MSQQSFDFDQRTVDDAIGRIRAAAEFIGALRGFVPTDPLAASALYARVAELRAALEVLARLAESVDRVRNGPGAGR